MTSLPGAIAVDSGTVLMLITLVVLPIAAFAFAHSGKAWKELGKGAFAIDQDLPPRQTESPAVEQAVQEAEMRQMLEAKAYRHRQRGEAPINVEQAMASLLERPVESPAADAELRVEVRRLVIARNERRMRQGEEPLDVEAETERQLAQLA